MAAFEFHMIETPKELPEGFPALDPNDLGAYHAREVVGLMIIDAMIAYACVTQSPPSPEAALVAPAFVGSFLRQDGTVVTPNQCTIIARELRSVLSDGVPAEALEFLRTSWNQRQEERKAAALAKGEDVSTGYEPFTFAEQSVRNTLAHWGFFNAIAADHGGYRVT